MAQLDGVAVSKGPGAFTGLRVGLATAAGLATAIDRPVWTGCSLSSRALRVAGENPVLSMLDARKKRVYAEAWAAGARVHEPADVPPSDALAWCSPGFIATGEGALVYRALVEDAGGVVAEGSDDPAVGVLAGMAAEGLTRGEGARALDVAPMYIRPPDAKPSNKGRI
jgi:tRNA threonylcarbamoyladenosine biosynthesis protein TsaB